VRALLAAGAWLAIAAAASAGGAAEEKDMADALAMANLYQLARMRASGAIPDEARQSLPIPVRAPGGVQVLFFFAPAQLSAREGLRVAPPDYLERIDPVTGALVELRAVKPAEFGQRHAPNQPLGSVALGPDLAPEQYVALRSDLFALFDRLLPAFAANEARPGDALRRDARELRAAFERLREEPLAPYYAAIGAEFFGWLDAVAR
jgi:hypothetical protein